MKAIAALRARAFSQSRRSEDLTIGFILLALVVGFWILSPPGSFLSTENIKNIGVDASELMILSAGMTLLLIAGGLDLSIGSVVVFAAVLSAKTIDAVAGTSPTTGPLVYHDLGLAIAAGVAVAIASGVAWGLFNSFVILRMKVPPFIATLASLGMALGLAEVISHGTNVSSLPLPLQEDYGLGEALGIVPWPIVTAAAVTAVLWILLSKTRFGLRTYAIGANPESARRAGIRVDRHMLTLYVLMGALAGIVSVVDVARFGTATLAAHSQDALSAISAVVIGGTSLFGGRGRMFGTVIGVLIPAVLLNGFVILQIESFWQNVAVGAVLIVAVYIDQMRRQAGPST
ncbi:MAG: ABC transporter permease [Actinobacteria bacterium]|nr:ABC transporter permease [Actinomycetota bacterium]